MSGIKVTGNDQIDTATAELAIVLRDADGSRLREQSYYDQAMRLRNEIMKGTGEQLMEKLRDNGCHDQDWNGGDVVEVVDSWLQKLGVDTHAVQCEHCGNCLVPAEYAEHIRELTEDDMTNQTGYGVTTTVE